METKREVIPAFTILLLGIIYLAFISLGLPDSVLGVAIPPMQIEWGMPLWAGGAVSMIAVGAGAISSFGAGYVIDRLGTGRVVLISCTMTGAALLGYSLVPGYFWLLPLAIPMGLGGGAVDAALNDYVAIHFKAHHMNWLHSFWGVGATAGPLVMAGVLTAGGSWRNGYQIIGAVQLGLAAVLLSGLPLWAKHGSIAVPAATKKPEKPPRISALPGLVPALATMFAYTAMEAAVGLWGSTFLVRVRGLAVETAAAWMAAYYGGITAGRFASGFLSFRLSNRRLIRVGILTSLAGAGGLLMPLPEAATGAAFLLIGLGFSPVFPSMIHETPVRFGEEASRRVIGLEMGCSYLGIALVPPLIGLVLQFAGVRFLPVIVLGGILAMLATSERTSVAAREPV